jgi:PAT family beta-lactamase induction signal transducer AmpG
MTISSMIGTALGGWVYMRWGLYRSLITFGIAQALTNLLYMALALAGKQLWLVIVATSVDNLAGGMGQAAFTAFLMAQCSVNFSATQYALLSAISALPRVMMQPVAGFVVARIGWANFFVVTFLTATPGIVLLILQRARIRALDASERLSAAASR